MKIWPWDRFAPPAAAATVVGPAGRSVLGLAGSYISADDVEAGLDAVRCIRRELGNKMEILIEGHGRWDLNSAIRIGRALQPFDILWMEDMIKPDSSADLSRLRQETRVPLCVSERLFTRYGYRDVLEQRAADVIMTDVAWTGGITEAQKIAILADSFHLPMTPHDCTGLATLLAHLHLFAASPYHTILETVRGFYEGWYREVYTENIRIDGGFAEFPTGAGLGTALRDDFLRSDVTSRMSRQ